MKHLVITSILTLAALSLALPVAAQNVRVNVSGSASGTPANTRAEQRVQVEVRRASTTERRVELQRGLAKRKALHTSRVMAATIERLEKILARIESRIE